MNSLDYNISLWLNSIAGRTPAVDALAVFTAVYLVYFFSVAAALYWFHAREILRARKAVLLAFLSFAVSRGIIVPIIRLFWIRQRPFMASAQIVELINKGNEAGFPSGHASAMFAIAMAIYFYNKKLGGWLFAMAILTGIARVVVGVHYPSDILGGAALGIAVAWVLQKFLAPHLDGVTLRLSKLSDRCFGIRRF